MSLKLAVLGLLMEADSHPYEIRQKMKERGMHHYIKLMDGSLYYAIEKLRASGHVDAVEVVRDTNRPDKTIYRITEEGKALFLELLMDQLDQPLKLNHPMYAALKFAAHGNEEDIARVVETRIAACERWVEDIRALYEEHIPEVPRAVLHLMHGAYEHAMTELRWLKRLHVDAAAGRLKEVGKPLDAETEAE